ncbi:MAG: DUF4403 family protein [Bacteroidota bacterium]|nr:DUF4403 family protein [Flavisolibacter sp.]MBD0350573.1 DUF4403 family protein [Flavisolibacter sp.]MBD0375899.1 DUF4403 family protein [Flavisolibacter sp.]MDQ3844548.1 DUF4403 family protein [Bacteroidota bacterium]
MKSQRYESTKPASCLFLLVVIMLNSCRDSKNSKYIEPSSPNVKVDTNNFKKSSIISAPIEINLQPAFEFAERQLPQTYGVARYNEDFGSGGADYPDCGYSCGYKVSRTPLRFSMKGNVLTTHLQFGYWLDCRARKPCTRHFHPLITVGCNDRRAHGSLSTVITIDNKWNSSVITRNNGVSPNDDCKVGPWGIFDVTNLVMKGFNRAFERIGRNLDSRINEQLNSRKRIEHAWIKLSTPIAIKDLGWLSLSPESIKVSNLILEHNVAKINFYAKLSPEIILGKQPTVTIRPLPENMSFSDSNALKIFLPISMEYSFAEAQIKKKLKINEGSIRYPSVGNKYLKVTDISLTGYGKKVVVKITFAGTKDGYAYFIGTPSFDMMTNVLSFPDLDYTIETRSIILKAIDFLKHDVFIKDFRNKLTINLNKKVLQLKNKVNEALNKQYNDFTLYGNISNFRVLGLYSNPQKNLLTTYFEINGELNVRVF